MVDFKKLLERTPEEIAQAEKEAEENAARYCESVKNDPSVKRMKRLLGEE
jgi:hypothetical protein